LSRKNNLKLNFFLPDENKRKFPLLLMIGILVVTKVVHRLENTEPEPEPSFETLSLSLSLASKH
jgi:hypothetical protein